MFLLPALKNKRQKETVKVEKYWTFPAEQLFGFIQSSKDGLSFSEAEVRLKNVTPAIDTNKQKSSWAAILWNQVKSPLIWILIFASIVSLTVQQWTEAIVILMILFFSTVLGFYQEYRASTAVQKLLARVQLLTKVLRDGREQQISHDQVVPGDIVLLSAGSMIPADGVLLESKDLFVNEALMTGETLPAEKNLGVSQENSSIAQRTNCVFMGTSVRSGTAKVLVMQAGADTEFGKIAKRLELRPSQTDFEKGLRDFGFLLTKMMFVFLILVFFCNVLLSRPLLDSLLFSLALAVGISPELLPAILSVTLSKGAQDMTKKGVLIKRLNSIENLGSMDVLCCDKTGTLTTGTLLFQNATDVNGNPVEDIKHLAWLNAKFQTGLTNPLDEAILNSFQQPESSQFKKVDEVPYDFSRKRLTIAVNEKNSAQDLLVTKGALSHVVDICTKVQQEGKEIELTSSLRRSILQKIENWGKEGIRVLGLATKQTPAGNYYSKKDEIDFTFRGFLLFQDEIHKDAKGALDQLQKLSVQLKIMTGDNRYVSLNVAQKVGLEIKGMLTGEEINQMSNEALLGKVANTSLFVELDPSQKEKIVDAYKKRGHVVGFLGDGINDAPALNAADVGLSVESAVDVAKEAADVVFVKPNLRVLALGVSEGRVIFANTLKYIFITTSANFGNMISMAVASVFLPFLPLTAAQVLLNNFLSDIPSFAIGRDHVERDWRRTPHRWNISVVKKFMMSFGFVSSLFDLITFAFLLKVFKSSVEPFQTGWFLESLFTQIFVIFVVRSFKPFFKSRPSRWLVFTAVFSALVGLFLVYSPLNSFLGFVSLPAGPFLGLIAIVILYAVFSEITKAFLFRSIEGFK
ncbi:MAG: magnesium-translocating P-type ATPase [Bdellovibrio sp.]